MNMSRVYVSVNNCAQNHFRNITVILPEGKWQACDSRPDDIVLALMSAKHFYRAPIGMSLVV